MFKIGDLVIGNSKNGYTVTRKGAICLVLDVNKPDDLMRVCLIADDIHEYVKNEKFLDLNPKNHTYGEKFGVNCDEFDLFTGVSPDKILTGVFFKKDIKKLITLKKDYISNPNEYIYIGEI